MQNHNDDTIKTSDTVLWKNIPLTLLKGLCVRGSWSANKDCNIMTPPHSYGNNSVSFPFSWAAQPWAWGPSLSGTWSSFQHLLSNCNCSIGGLRAPSAGCWFSLPHLIFNSLERPVAGII